MAVVDEQAQETMEGSHPALLVVTHIRVRVINLRQPADGVISQVVVSDGYGGGLILPVRWELTPTFHPPAQALNMAGSP